jgi:hypothetical protein
MKKNAIMVAGLLALAAAIRADNSWGQTEFTANAGGVLETARANAAAGQNIAPQIVSAGFVAEGDRPAGSSAHADIVYKGVFENQPVTLFFDVQTPCPIIVETTPGMHDEELGVIPARTSISASPGTIRLKYKDQMLTGKLWYLGDRIEAYFPLEMQGEILGGPMFFNVKVDASQQQINGIQFPSELNVTWELEENAATQTLINIHSRNPPIIKFTR